MDYRSLQQGTPSVRDFRPSLKQRSTCQKLVDGGIPRLRVREECRMPDGEKHIDDTGECTHCEAKAWTNAERYIAGVVLPEVEKLRSKTMGLDGELVPPSWGAIPRS
ncbi:hypothetical protein PRK78_007174 [Emydomyces testavorans]|uniref:Uncharacterized protein n=1 Tax=Emydomyces testavorans TaxID=2070801 RepID=A0AAF0DN90_9EURO|nr:hypothetical protein PRK78_007174 [Emydomyces testavorans]